MADRTGGAGAVKYEPGPDAATRYPEWVIRHRSLGGVVPEVLCPVRKVILIDSGQTWPEKRCSLAHAVAHLDLGHVQTAHGHFAGRQERDADQLAARRLITVRDLAAVLCWTRYRTEVAAELDVDLPTLATREHHMHPSERHYLRRSVRWLEETA